MEEVLTMIIFNLDAILDNCENRDDIDERVCPVIYIFDSLRRRNEINIWTGRYESIRNKTLDSIESIVSGDWCLHKYLLKMRPEGDNTPEVMLKERWLDELIISNPIGWDYMKQPIEFVVDICHKSIKMWKRRGVFVFDVNQGEKDF